MSRNQKTNRWRRFVLRMVALSFLWMLLATTFAAQFYWIGKAWPLMISWKEAFLHSLIEWTPWLILSPLVIWLAERFRFDHAHRLWSALTHLLACVLVTLAYQGISTLLLETRRSVVTQDNAGHVRVVNGAPGEFHVFASGTNPLTAAPPPSGGFVFGGHPGFGFSQGPVSVNFSSGLISPGTPSAGAVEVLPSRDALGVFGPPFLPPMPGPWTRFLQISAARAQSTVPIYWAIVCVTWVFSYYQQLRDRERRTLELEARLTQANLQTLKAQLQPHFLFNTLNAIASLTRRKPEIAEDMIGSLSDFLRMSLTIAQEHEAPLRRELDFLNLYLEIQQARFGERLRIQIEIDPLALDGAVPTLILQPLVENSIHHGIESQPEGGTIVVRALRQENRLRLQVRDDGRGLGSSQLKAIREGIGWSNTKARLQELYGDAHRFQIESNSGKGLTVTVEFPWRSMDRQMGNPG